MLNSVCTGRTFWLKSLILAGLFLFSCLAQSQGSEGLSDELSDESDQSSTETTVSYQHPEDPWEGYNRAIFSFNDGLDRYFAKPVAKGYQFIMPGFAETGVSNMFDNVGEIKNVANDVLQWKWGQAAHDTGRFLVNSTVGLVGFFDVAQYMGLERSDGEDFGQTLAVWGVKSGPYFVLPILGPSTIRDSAGLPVDAYTSVINYIDHVPTRNTVMGIGLISDRAQLLQAEALLSGDRYAFMRDAYLQRRGYLISDGQTISEDDFGADFDDDFDEDEW